MLTGKAKADWQREYMREYMRKKRAGQPTKSKPKSKSKADDLKWKTQSAALKAEIAKLKAEVRQLQMASAGETRSDWEARKSKNRSAGAKQAAVTRKHNKLWDAYSAKFGGLSATVTPAIDRAVERAVRTGKDQPLLIKQRKANKRSVAEYNAKLAAEHAQPFTAELEKHYTARVKNRHLFEGDCERPWQNYFAFREAHKCEPLTAGDVQYLNQWTACPSQVLTGS